MSSADGTCARTRGCYGESNSIQSNKNKASSTDEMSADSDSDKSERWSDASEPSEQDFSVLEAFVEDPGDLKVSPQRRRVKAMDVESKEVDITEEEDLYLDSGENTTKDRKSEEDNMEKISMEIEQIDSKTADTKASRGKSKDSHKRKGSDHVKGSKKNERNKDKHIDREKKDSKRKQEETGDKRSYKREKKLDKSQSWERNHDNRKDKHRSISEKDYGKVSRYERDEKRAKADTNSDDEHSQRRDRHWDSSKSHQFKSTNKTDREKDTKRTKAESEQRVAHSGRSGSRSPQRSNNRWHTSGKEQGRSPSPRYKDKDEREWVGRDKSEKEASSKFRRFGASGLGGYSPRRRRSDAAVKTPSPPPRSPERRKPRAWDLPPAGVDSSIVAAMAAAQQAAAQQAAALASVSSLVTGNPAVTAVTLTQATRQYRRLYIGNVPPTVSDGELMEFMNAAMMSANVNHLPGTKPCINCLVNVEKSYAFAEFLTPEDATAGLAFDGVTLHGTTLKIRRPKDYIAPPNGVADIASAVVDMVSSVVVDSPRKVFVGGICRTLSSDKVKEIVTAFGQLKAYHWEVTKKNNQREAYAFIEYLDPSVTLKACVGLNGMRLGNNILTVVQATPDAKPEQETTGTPFYGVPEHAKTLLQSPTRILELQNVISEEEILNMSEVDLQEIEEDIRLECTRFGTVKSMHIVKPEDGAMKPPLGSLENDQGTDAALHCFPIEGGMQTGLGSGEAYEGNVQCIAPQEGTAPSLNGSVGPTEPGAGQNLVGHLIGIETVDVDDTVPGFEGQHISDNKLFDQKNVNGKEAKNSIIQNDMHSEQALLCMQNIISMGSEMNNAPDGRGKDSFQSHDSNLGRVYVEYTREECACLAAHALHGRLYGDRKVVCGYFPLRLYQKRFRKGLEPQTFEEKQARAWAAQEHLNSYIKDY